jgi:hypothetical protein
MKLNVQSQVMRRKKDNKNQHNIKRNRNGVIDVDM